MDIKNKVDTEEQRMQRLLDLLLVSRTTLKSSAAETSFHLDEDSLAAFVEGNLGERESRPLVSHLVDCGFCRHKTVELLRLDLEFEGFDMAPESVPANRPSKVSEVLSGLFAKIFGNAEGAVFAHNEEDDDDAADRKDKETEKDDDK